MVLTVAPLRLQHGWAVPLLLVLQVVVGAAGAGATGTGGSKALEVDFQQALCRTHGDKQLVTFHLHVDALDPAFSQQLTSLNSISEHVQQILPAELVL